MNRNSILDWFGIKAIWEQLSEAPILIWPILLPALAAKLAFLACVLAMTVIVVVTYPTAVEIVLEHISRVAISTGTESNSAQSKGEEWQKGKAVKGSLIRSGGSLNSDDLRRRVYELRSTASGR